MSDWLASIEGTSQARNLALFLAMLAALLHAVFGAMQKGKMDPWIVRGCIDLSYFLISIPIVLFVVPWPQPELWPLLFGAMGIHFVYKLFQALAYSRGAYTVVYPVVRGTGPLVTLLAVGAVFSEHYTAVQWGGVACLSLGIFALAALNLSETKDSRAVMGLGLFFAVLTGFMVAAYTTWDALGVRVAINPFTFIFWLFLLDGILFPWISLWYYRRMDQKPLLWDMAIKGLIGAFVAFASFGAIMFATRLDRVGEVAVLRETSVVFAALIGWLFLKERVGALRALLMIVIGGGAVLVEFGG